MDEIKLSGFCDPRFSKIKDLLEESLVSGFDTGASVAIEHEGKMVVNLSGGYKDLDKNEPWTEDTILNVFSTTKAVTAICIAKLIDQGKLDISKNVSELAFI